MKVQRLWLKWRMNYRISRLWDEFRVISLKNVGHMATILSRLAEGLSKIERDEVVFIISDDWEAPLCHSSSSLNEFVASQPNGCVSGIWLKFAQGIPREPRHNCRSVYVHVCTLFGQGDTRNFKQAHTFAHIDVHKRSLMLPRTLSRPRKLHDPRRGRTCRGPICLLGKLGAIKILPADRLPFRCSRPY